MGYQRFLIGNLAQSQPSLEAGSVYAHFCGTNADLPGSYNVGDFVIVADPPYIGQAISTTEITPKVIRLTGQSADIAATTITSFAGAWDVKVYHVCDGGTGGIPPTPGSLATTIRWSDGGVAKNNKPAADITLDYTNRAGADGNKICNHTTGNLTYEADYTAGDAGTATYELLIRADLLRKG